jgi:hypothetical protein
LRPVPFPDHIDKEDDRRRQENAEEQREHERNAGSWRIRKSAMVVFDVDDGDRSKSVKEASNKGESDAAGKIWCKLLVSYWWQAFLGKLLTVKMFEFSWVFL